MVVSMLFHLMKEKYSKLFPARGVRCINIEMKKDEVIRQITDFFSRFCNVGKLQQLLPLI
jgi:hypothetical protein